MATHININGKTVVVHGDGSKVVVRNGVVTVNGVEVEQGLSGIVKIEWSGPLAHLEADGDVDCGEVEGSVSAGGNVQCESVGGSVSAGGNVAATSVGGRISAGSNVSVSR